MLHRNRTELLKVLEMLAPGVNAKGSDQSNCYVFKDGAVFSFNGEVACYHAAGLGEITGAVPAASLLNQLHKWAEDDIELEADGPVLWVYGNRKKAHFNMESEVVLPVGQVTRPAEADWKELPPRFCDAVGLVQACAGKDLNKFQATCVHLHPDWIEATDNTQVARFTIPTGFVRTLVRATSIRGVASLGMTHACQTDTWVHFRNAAGLVYSCLRYDDEYPDVGDALKVEGTKTHFPKTLQDSIDRAELFSREKSDDNQVEVALLPGKLRIKGVGSSGGYDETREVAYDGERMKFLIAPRMLAEIVRDHNEIYLAPGKIVVDGGAFVYRTCTGVVDE